MYKKSRLLLAELLYSLFGRKFADEQSSVAFCHDVTVQSLYNHLFTVFYVDDAVGSFVRFDVLADDAVVVGVFL